MDRRPVRNETEEDLLRLQSEYNKIIGKEPQQPVLHKAPSPCLSGGIIGNIVERSQELNSLQNKTRNEERGFPSVFHVDSNNLKQKGTKKKSLFAQNLKNNSDNINKMDESPEEVTTAAISDSKHLDIHEENVRKIESMSKEEILEQKKTLESTLDPAMLEFLKKRGAKKPKSIQPAVSNEPIFPSSQHVTDDEAIKRIVELTLDKKWMDIDKIEPEKLEWIGDIPDVTALEADKPYSARFDFKGELQPFQAEVDVRQSLHHHGEEPARAGYTIQELYQLTRSTVLQQRTIGLTTLAHVIRKTKLGYYDKCFDGALLHKLVESDVFFLLRFAMDDRATTAAAVACLYELFVCRSDEVCLDRLQNVAEPEPEPYLYVAVEKEEDSEEQDLKDHQIIAQDLVRGVLRTDAVVRFAYVLRNFALDAITISRIFDIVIRVCRHSPEACEKVIECTYLVSYLFEHLGSSQCCAEAVKLLRVLSFNTSHAHLLVNTSSHDFEFILKCIDSDEPIFKLKLECLTLWSTLLRHGLLLDKLSSFSSRLNRLLYFYVCSVNTDHGRFDFELFSGIVAVLNSLATVGVFLDNSFDSQLCDCLLKWLTQLKSNSKWNYSVAKALGAAFQYFVLKYQHQGVTGNTSNNMHKVGKLLPYFIDCDCFKEMCDNLITYSHIRHYETVGRDPANLPSLCSVYENGSDYLKLVQDGSAFPLMSSLINFVIILSEVSPDTQVLPRILLTRFENYSLEIQRSRETSSWFARYEVNVLLSLLKLKFKCDDAESVKFAFRLVPFLRTDDRRVLQVIDLIFSNMEFSEVATAYKEYANRQFKSVVYHDCDNFPRHWVYEPIASAPKQILKCISYILENCPDLISNVPPTLRFVHLCLVLLDSDNVFNVEINSNLEKCLDDVIQKFDLLNLQSIMIGEKSFYELYRDLVTEYAGSSYGHPLFAKVITIPLSQKFDVSYRKLMWSEFIHALRVITLPKNVDNFIPMDVFTSPTETDDSLLILYLNAVSKNVLTEARNGFIYEAAIESVRKYLQSEGKDEKLAALLRSRILSLTDEILKRRLLSLN